MSRKEINIGIEGNDGTGDSIRDSFQKVNQNFTELYAILGQGGKLSFIGLADVEKDRVLKEYRTADNNRLLVVDAEGEQIVFKELVGSETIIVNQSFPGQIRLSSLASALINDPDPTLQTNLNANFKRLTNLSDATEDTDAATKGYTDTKLSLDGTDSEDVSGSARPDWGVMRGPLVLSRNPIESDDLEYNGLVAATKAYVDSKTFISQYNIYVSPLGQDERTDIPQNQIGRSEATAFGSVQKACEVAEELVNNAPLELGPYQKILTYANGTKICEIVSVEESELSGLGCTAQARMGIDEVGSALQILIAGTGYQKDDILTPVGGTFLGQETQFRVIAVDFAGSILQLAINEDADGVKQNGVYSILPASHVDNDFLLLSGGSGSGTARIRARWKVTQIDVTDTGEGYTSASVIFIGGGGSGSEAFITEIGGEIKEITVSKPGVGYTGIPSVNVFLPRLLITTERLNTDFLDDIREGQAIRGETSGALARIVQHDGSLDEDGNEIFEIEILNGVFQIGESLKYADLTRNIQITIHVETGIYYENYPLRLAENVTLRGDDLRRSIVRPKPGVSQSPWARVFFRRDRVVDGLRVTDFEYGYQYLTDPLDYSSQPKNNDQMDVLLCNDATRASEISFQGHGGFVMVLDPNGQILSKSPYFQTGTSFSKSINEKQFAGGMYIDGFSGNLEGVLLGQREVDPSDPAYIPSDPTTFKEYEKVIIGGLLREPNLPTSFDVNDQLYRITLANRVETDLFDAKILLERNRRFIQTETVSFVNGEFPNLDFNAEKCFRDVGLLVDAVVDDVIFGGFLNSTEAARLYFVGGNTVVSGQVAETVAAIVKAKEVAVAAITQDIDYARVGTVDQTFLPAYPNGGDAQAVVEQAFDLIANIIEYGESIYKAKNLLQANKEIIQAETIAYLDALYPTLNYDRDTCYRDVGYIIDAWSIDIFGDFNNSVRAGYAYYQQGIRIIPDAGPTSQLAETIDGIEYAAILAKRIVKNELLGGLVRTTKSFNPSSNIDLTSNTITILDHGFKSGSRIKYSSGGGNSIVVDNLDDENGDPIADINDFVFYVYVVDGDNIQLVENLPLLIAKEKGVSTAIELNIVGTGSGTTHTLEYYQITDPELVVIDITDSGVEAAINTGRDYITTLISGETAGVPGIYPQYECVLDTPYYGDGLFNQAKCARDVGLILDAVNYDMVLGSNYQSVKAGLSYLRSYSSVVIDEQKQPTINGITKAEVEALALIPESIYSAARSAYSNRFEIIKDIIRNGVGAAPAVTYPLPASVSVGSNKAKAVDVLVANRDFIKTEIVAYVTDTNPSFEYDTVKCARDVAYLLDGMIYDLLYGGNSQTKNNGETYYRDGESFVPDQEVITASAFTRLRTVLFYVVQNDTVSWTKSSSNILTQNTSNPAATSTEGTTLQTLTDILIDYVADEDYDTPVTEVLPTIIGQDANLLAARTEVIAAKETIKTAVLAFLENVVGKVVLSTAGNKSMLGNDFTQVNDMGYGIFCNNNGLSEQVSVFTYYCYTAFYSLNGSQIRSLNGSSAHGVFGLKAEGNDPNEIPDTIFLKFPMVQIAEAYENIPLEIENDRNGATIWITNYSYLPRSGCIVDIDHSGDRTDTINPAASVVLGTRYEIATLGTTDWNVIADTIGIVYAVGDQFTTVGAGNGDGTVYTLTTVGQRSYVAETVTISGLPTGVAKLQLSTVAANSGLAVYVKPGKPVVVRSNEEFVLGDKEEVVAVRPSTALIFDENTGTAIRLLSFNQYDEPDAGDSDQIITTRDGYQYVKLTILKDTEAFDVPTGFGEVGDDSVIIQALNFRDSKRVVFQTTGATIYDGSTTGTGGMIFGYQDSMYEITDYQVNNLDPNNIFGIISFKNITNPLAESRTYTISVTGSLPAQVATTTDHNLSNARRVKINSTNFYVKNVISNVTHGPLSGTNVFPATGGGSSATFTITRTNSISYAGIAINAAGTGYDIGDTIRILGTSLGGATPKNDVLITVNDVGGSGDITEAIISRGIATQVRMELQLYLDEELTTPVNSSALGSATTMDVLGGLTYSPLEANGTNVSFDGGIRAGATGTVTVNISTMRATGHDFLDIGTGSYADTNYPSNIFGEPANEPDVEAQVVEVTTGRVFYVSTDQNGNFKVGDFFAVDQGTGKLTLDAKIDLKGIDSLKLRSGNEIFEFTNDITMGGEGAADPQAVPTEYAIRSYIDKRLGLNHFGVRVTDGLRGPGYLALDGSLAVKGTIEMDGNTLRNLPAPRKGAVGDTEAVPKFYMRLGNLEDSPEYWRPAEGSPTYAIQRADILAFTGTDSQFSHATMTGALTFTLNTTTPNDPFVVSTINDNVIVNDDINYDAAILQHKLQLNYIRDTAADGFVITAYTTVGATSGHTRFTANGHGITENDSIEILGETTGALTGINKRWKAVGVTTNTFDIPITGLTGVLSGNAKVREPGLLSGAKTTEFQVSANGFLQLRSSASTTTGVTFDKLAYIDPAVYDATDETSYSGGGTKLLGRRALPTAGSVVGQPVPIDARTIIRDGFGLSKFDVPLEGILARIDLSNDPGDDSFTSISYSSANSGNALIRRDADGNFSANAVTVNSLLSNGNITIVTAPSEVSNPNGIRMTINSTTATVLQRAIEATGDNAYKTVLRNGNGGNGIVIVDGNSNTNKHTDYYANEHRFYDATGGSGTIYLGNGILKAASGAGATIQGAWSLDAGATFQATWADLAEWYSSDKEYAPGTVLEFGGDAEVRASSKQGTTRVAGVVTTNPAYVMNQGLEGTRTCVALQGRVPCKVVGKVQKGDLMITSSITGVAVSAGEVAQPGTIIGKALQNYDSDHIGSIEVAVGRL